MNKLLFLTGALLLPLFLSCGVGRKLTVPSEVAIGNERYHVDTVKQRWGRFGGAPERTCLHFRNVRDTIVGTEKARVIREGVSDHLIRRDTIDNKIVEEYLVINPYYYSENTLEAIPDSVLNQALYTLNGELSTTLRRRMIDNLTLFCVELLVGSNGLILESCQYVFMDTLRIDKEVLDFCAKLDSAVKNASIFYKGSIWMQENDIPYGPTRIKLMMTEDGLVQPGYSQIRELIERGKDPW